MLVLFAIAPAFAQEGPDEWESNDEMRLADSIDTLYIQGEIGRQSDNDDWFILEGQEGTDPYITLYYDDSRCDIDMEIYSDDEYVGSLTSSSSPDGDEFYVPGTCYLHVYVYSGHGDYEIEIEPGGGGGHYSGDDCEGPDEWESNDEMDLADYIDNLEIEGYMCEYDEDWFVLDGSEGTNPTITLYYDDYYCDIDMEIYSDDDYVGSLTSSSSPDSDSFHIPGECYLYVYSYDGEGEYYIEIDPGRGGGRDDRPDRRDRDCEGPDEVESNDDADLADWIDGYEIEGYACEGDDDWYVLDGQEGYYPEIVLYYDDYDCDLDLEVYSDDEYSGSLTSTSSPDSDFFDIPGTCYIHVYSYSGEGEYTVEIWPDEGNGYSGGGDCEGPDEWESNDDMDLADYIDGYTIEGYCCVGDGDWFVLDGQEGSRPEFTLYYDDYECDIDMEVYDDDEYVGSLSSTDSPDWDTFRIRGTCYLYVYSYSGEGEYTIEIEP